MRTFANFPPETEDAPMSVQRPCRARSSRMVWQGQQGSNLRPAVLETAALPTELYPFRPPAPPFSSFPTERRLQAWAPFTAGRRNWQACFLHFRLPAADGRPAGRPVGHASARGVKYGRWQAAPAALPLARNAGAQAGRTSGIARRHAGRHGHTPEQTALDAHPAADAAPCRVHSRLGEHRGPDVGQR